MARCPVFCSGLCWRWLGAGHGNSQCRAQRQTIMAENLAAAFFSPARLAAKNTPQQAALLALQPRRLNGEPVKGLLCAVAAPFAKRPSRGACAKSLHMCASATNGRYHSAHGSQGCPCLGKGCNKEHAHWLPCPKVCCCKRQHLPCCQCLPGRQPARFCSFCVACFAPCRYCLCKARPPMCADELHGYALSNTHTAALSVCATGWRSTLRSPHQPAAQASSAPTAAVAGTIHQASVQSNSNT